MAQTAPAQSPPSTAPKRPRGILKNSSSFQHQSPDARISPTAERPAISPLHDGTSDGSGRPGLPPREMSEKEITQMNTEINAGEAARRRSSSNLRGSMSRRQSSQSGGPGQPGVDESGTRLKWDEANLYLNEGQMGGKMKIDEPKTPFAKQYNPAEDEEEIENINAQDLAVDELDMNRARKSARSNSGVGAKEADIPGLDLGEPEMDAKARRESDERRVHVDSDSMDVDGARHGEEQEAGMSDADRDKHRKFEEARKKHYEMKNIKNLLGHPDKVEEMVDEDEDM